MPHRKLKAGYLVLEGLNSLATVYYFYYFYFFMEQRFGFDSKANLELAAFNGALYMIFAWGGGRFAQRFGYFTALKLGFATMMCALAAGLGATTPTTQIAAMAVTVLGMSFTWPTLEAMVSEGETRAGLQHMVGLYNVIWAATGAVGYFTGGAMLDRFGLRSLFYVPASIQFVQLAITFWLEARVHRQEAVPAPEPNRRHTADFESFRATAPKELQGQNGPDDAAGLEPSPSQPVLAAEAGAPAAAGKFLRMAWLANPFGYIAINTLLAAMPGVAQRLGLSTTMVGVCCSVWCFARFGSFFALWHWNGWHYRFRWLLLAYLGLIASFTVILTVHSLWLIVLAQLVLGSALGLLYYSSLFYSMDSSDTKGEHGGIHEAAIGLGNCAGPAVGAASLHFLPQYANSGVFAVSSLLLLGLAGLLSIQLRPGPSSR